MAFVSSLLQAPLFIETLVPAIANNPTVKRIESYLPTIAFALLTRQFTFEVDGFVVSAKANAVPVALTLSAAILALEHILSGNVGTFLCGVIEVDISRASAPVVPVAVK
jgi:hypothetical protein